MTAEGPALISRRGVLAGVAGAMVTTGCGSAGTPGRRGPGTTGADQLKRALPAYMPSKSVTPDIPSVAGAGGAASDPAFLSYPADPVQTVTGVPGSGGTYVTRTPLWGAIPPSNGNSYYDAVNAALGATLRMRPADGNTYVDALPALFASGRLPDWTQIPSWVNQRLNLGTAVERFADLTPYLSGDKIATYPNLANIPTSAWQAAVWNGRLYGIPSYSTTSNFPGYLFYRKDLFEKAGVSAEVRSAEDLFALGEALTDAKAGRWAFDDLWPYLLSPIDVLASPPGVRHPCQEPDVLRLGVERPDGTFDVLAELDGRYLSTEVAGGFTGRVIGMYAATGTVGFDWFDYEPLEHG
ncbi:putative aldouronate transport system substrate-binding protein [Nonomuraea solani]|uniref:Putative aldouronate transport system substrate-binding protein n=1 Tax=Nonomuraea solani TaxID=1144553 RepID=A0A1H6EEQ6_9ACTN|nr:extracellular solute-binding protein [Nonomuraea solani]SEG95753.1 putative aldouronate transport system substrate-binding protein [Nonomuraea solani]